MDWLKSLGQIAEWEFEPQTFWFHGIKRGVTSYLPDFKVYGLNGSHEWHEVKGYMDAKSATKIKRFKKYYPEEKLVIVDKQFFYNNRVRTALAIAITNWEKTTGQTAQFKSTLEVARENLSKKTRKCKREQ